MQQNRPGTPTAEQWASIRHLKARVNGVDVIAHGDTVQAGAVIWALPGGCKGSTDDLRSAGLDVSVGPLQ
jgi:hypothetical protein